MAKALQQPKNRVKMAEAASIWRRVQKRVMRKYGVKPEEVSSPLETLYYLSMGLWPNQFAPGNLKDMPVPADMQMDAAKGAAQYLHPKLAAAEVTGADGGPIVHEVLSMATLMADPIARRKIEDLQVQMSTMQRTLPPPENMVLDATIITVEEEEISNGGSPHKCADSDYSG